MRPDHSMDWLTGEKGQPVAIHTGGGYSAVKLTSIERTTKTQAITADGQRFWLKDGARVGEGGSYHSTKLRPPDAPEVRRILQRQAFEAAESAVIACLRQARDQGRKPRVIVEALRKAREEIEGALAACGTLWVAETDGEAPECLSAPAVAPQSDRACVCTVDISTNPPFMDCEADCPQHGWKTRDAVLAAAAERIRARMHPPRLGGIAYWHGLNDAALLVEGRPLDG